MTSRSRLSGRLDQLDVRISVEKLLGQLPSSERRPT
jgi:hypothetical protein